MNCIAPGHIPTGITNYDMGAVIRLTQPLQRHGVAEDVANAVLYLAERPLGADHRDRGAGRRRDDRRARRPSQMRETSMQANGRRSRMPADLVIRGGTVFDGTGAPGRVADVAIADGVIREIGPNLRGERELDASGCVVAPGFIDIHTHYDAQVFWDPALRPSSYHGVTTVVAGQLRLHDRADPARAPRRDRAHARERRGHGRARR